MAAVVRRRPADLLDALQRPARADARTNGEGSDGGPTALVETLCGAAELSVRERDGTRQRYEDEEPWSDSPRCRLLCRGCRARERRVHDVDVVDLPAREAEERQQPQQEEERDIECHDACDRMEEIERRVLAQLPRREEDAEDPRDVERPYECGAGKQPGDTANDAAANEPKRSDADDAESDQRVDARARARDADRDLVAAVLDDVARARRAVDGGRYVRQRRCSLHRPRCRIRESRQTALQKRDVWQRPREHEKPDRKREWNERPRAEQEDDRRRREQRQSQEVDPHRPEVLGPEGGTGRDQAERGGGEDSGKDEVEAAEPEEGDVTVAPGRRNEQSGADRRDEDEIREGRVVAPVRGERSEREVIRDRDCGGRDRDTRAGRDVRGEAASGQDLDGSAPADEQQP